MVNEERLRYLIKIAGFDENDGKQCKPMTQYARKDYVSMQLLRSFVTGTIAYLLLFAMWALGSMSRLMQLLTGAKLTGFLVKVLVSYGIFLLLYLLVTYVVFNMKYTEGRRKVKKYYGSLKKVNQMYEREDRLKAPENKEWE